MLKGTESPQILPRELFVFRHGETDWNVEERFQGHLDIPLNANGRKQAAALIDVLRQNQVEVILSSDLSRARETGQVVASALGLPVLEDPRLREAHLGQAQGLTRHEIEAAFGEELARRWRSSHVSDADISYPGGETGAAIMSRVFEAFSSFFAASETAHYRKIGVATHGGVIRRIAQKLLPPGSPHVPIPNGVLYHLVNRGDQWEFRGMVN
jgi:probable phosphoglycerate mutase